VPNLKISGEKFDVSNVHARKKKLRGARSEKCYFELH
jgi:hypothetical protein